MDFSQMTDDELKAIVAGGAKPAAPVNPKFSQMTTEELQQIVKSAPKPEMPTIQEQHPELTNTDRFVVKNLANDNEESVNYLQKKHPNLEISIGPSNQIRARTRGSNEPYRVLDPEHGFFEQFAHPGEVVKDITDVTGDIISGAGSTAAGATAGLSGLAAGGIGAVPAAMAGSAAASTGIEGIKQALARAVGVGEGKGADYTSLLAAGGSGLLAPALFGTGATAAQIAAKKLAPEAAQALAASQKGLLGRGFDFAKETVLPKFGNLVSGAPTSTIKTLAKEMPTIKAIEASPTGVTDYINQGAELLKENFGAIKADKWAKYRSALGDIADAPVVDIKPVANLAEEALKKAEKIKDAIGTDSSAELYNELKSTIDGILKKNTQAQLTDDAGNLLFKPAANQIFSETGAPLLKGAPMMGTSKTYLDKLSPSAAAELERALADLAKFGDMKPEGVNILSHRLGGLGQTQQEISMLGAAANKALGKEMEKVVSKEALKAKTSWGVTRELEKQAEGLIKNPQQAFGVLRSADNTAKRPTLELMRKIDEHANSDLLKRASVLHAFNVFEKPSAAVLAGSGASSSGRAIPLAMAGGAAGALLGPRTESGSAAPSTFTGMALGGLLGSPAMLRRYVEAGLKAGAARQAVGNALPAAIPQAMRQSAVPALENVWWNKAK